MTDNWDIVIVGAGPAGVAAAWTILRLEPSLAERMVLLDAAHHPREKVCAGCVTGRSWKLLETMGLKVDVPSITIGAVAFLTALGDITLPRAGVARIVRRSQFDAELLGRVREKGVAVHEGARVLSASRIRDKILLEVSFETQIKKYLARAVLGADGATSAIRRHLGRTHRSPIRTMMAEVPAHPIPANDSRIKNNLVFDFRTAQDGFRGYRWIFPCMCDPDESWYSVGICDFDPLRRSDPKPMLMELLKEYGFRADEGRWREYPFYTFDMRDRLGGQGWLLAGEAAGSDNLLAEGISYAIESGALAAENIVEAFLKGDFSMNDYTHRYHWSRVGKELRTLKALADIFYGSCHLRVLRAGLFNEKLCSIGGEILAGELEPRTKLALRIAANLFKTMFRQALRPFASGLVGEISPFS